MTPSLEKLPNKAKDPSLTLRHGSSPPDANPVFLYHGDSIIIIIVMIIIIFIIIIITIIIVITIITIIIIIIIIT